MISARTSSGYDLDVDVQWFGEDIDIGFVMVDRKEELEIEGPIPDFYDKEVDGKPATDVILYPLLISSSIAPM